jgi:hypothetical protein
MIFMDTNPGIPGDDTFNITLAHEFQHLVNFNQTYILNGRKQFDTWINEGLSASAEYLYKKEKHPSNPHIEDKIAYYKNDDDGDIGRGVNFVTWTPSHAHDPYSSYATVYLFFQWLRIHAGNTVYGDIFTSPYMDYRAISDATTAAALGTGWPEILANWFTANALCKPSGLHGYEGDITGLNSNLYKKIALSGTHDLYPGEGVYTSKSNIPPGGTAGGKLLYREIDATYGMVINTDGNTRNPSPEHVTLAGIVHDTQEPVSAAAGAKSLSAAPAALSAPRPVDRVFRLPD